MIVQGQQYASVEELPCLLNKAYMNLPTNEFEI
jgi:hypothetical protein